MSPLQVAIVGAGRMGAWHAYYARRQCAHIAAVVDLRTPESWSNQWPKVMAYRDLDECLRRTSIDVVHVCTGPDSHAAIADAALRHRKHVLVEKPLAGTEEEARGLVQLALDQGCQLGTVLQFPFQRGYRWIERHLSSLGRIVRAEYRCRSAAGIGRLPEDRRLLLFEVLPHAHAVLNPLCSGLLTESPIDLARLVDDELTLAGRAQQVSWEVEIQLAGRPTRNELSIVASNGSAHVDFFHGFVCCEGGGASRLDKLLRPFRQSTRQLTAACWNLAVRTVRGEPAYPGLLQLIREFYGSIRTSTPFSQKARDVVDNAAFIDRIRALVEQPKTVSHEI
jgi:predicted dehydrogenase